MDYNFINEDIDNNKWFKLMKKWKQVKRKEKMNSYIECQPISLEYFFFFFLSVFFLLLFVILLYFLFIFFFYYFIFFVVFELLIFF
jgi:hypothetical protein